MKLNAWNTTGKARPTAESIKWADEWYDGEKTREQIEAARGLTEWETEQARSFAVGVLRNGYFERSQADWFFSFICDCIREQKDEA